MATIFKRLIILFVVMILFFTTTMVFIHLIPRESIENNVLKSAKILQQEHIYQKKWIKTKLIRPEIFRLDNYTDAIMLNIAVNADTDHPIEAAMLNNYYESEQWDAKAFDLEKSVEHHFNEIDLWSYARYWQGYQIFLRPMLCFTHLGQIRKINNLLMWTLIIFCVFLIWHHIGLLESVLFFLCLARVNIFLVPFSLQYSTCFYLMFISITILLLFPCLTADKKSWITTFFVIGGSVAFLDFLTTPLITLGIPLILLILKQKPENPCIHTILTVVSWFAGYAFSWSSKWIIGYLFTGQNILLDALDAAKMRVSSEISGNEITLKYLWDTKIFMPEPIIWVLISVFIVSVLIWALSKESGKKAIKNNLWIIMIAVIVPLWFILLSNHTFEHFWFTRRSLIVPLYAFCIWTQRIISAL